jgi:hypothetical protein
LRAGVALRVVQEAAREAYARAARGGRAAGEEDGD